MASISLIQHCHATLKAPYHASLHFAAKPVDIGVPVVRFPLHKSLPKASASSLLSSFSCFISQQVALQSLPEPAFSDSNSYPPITVNELRASLRLSVSWLTVNIARASHSIFLKLYLEDTRLGNSVISTYIKLGRVEDAYNVFLCIPYPDVASYSSIISCFAKCGQEHKALEIFMQMNDLNVCPNEYSFVAVLTACARIREFDIGSQIHAMAIKLGLAHHVFVGNSLMFFYSECGFLHEAHKLFDDIFEKDTSSWNTMICSLLKGGLHGEALQLLRDMSNHGFRDDELTLSIALSASNSSLLGREVHARSIRAELDGELSIGNALILFYTSFGSANDIKEVLKRMKSKDMITHTETINGYMEFGEVESAFKVFVTMPERNPISFNAMLSGLCRNNQPLKAVQLLIEMIRQGSEVTDFTLTSITKACALIGERHLSKQIHAFIVKLGCFGNPFVESSMIEMCIRCRRMKDAEKMFYRTNPEDSQVSRSSMVCGYARNALPEKALSLFLSSFCVQSFTTDEVELASVLGVCADLGSGDLGKQIHTFAAKTNFLSDVGVCNALISVYFRACGIKEAELIFNAMPSRDVVSWNCLISGYVFHKQGDKALSLYNMMDKTPDSITFSLVLSAYKHTKSELVDQCRSLFNSINPNEENYISFVGVLGRWGYISEAEELILKMPFDETVTIWRELLESCRIHMDVPSGKRIAKRILSIPPRGASEYALVSNMYSASGMWVKAEAVREGMSETGTRKLPCRSWVLSGNAVDFFYVRDDTHPCRKDVYSALRILIIACLKEGYEPDTSFVLHEVEEHQKKEFLFYHSAKLAATYGVLATKPGEVVRVVKSVVLCGDCHTFLKYVSLVTRREILVRDSSGFHFFSNGQCSCNDHW